MDRTFHLITALLRLVIPSHELERVLGDLDEEYRLHIRPLKSRFRAWNWYWKEGLSLLLAYTIARLRRNGSREVSVVLDARRFRRSSKRFDNHNDRKGNIMEALIQDIRFTIRILKSDPKYLFAAVITLAIGIGANTAIFSVLNGVLLKPLPYEEPGQLVKLNRDKIGGGDDHNFFTGLDYLDFRERNESFAHIACYYDYRQWGLDLSAPDASRKIIAMPVSSEYFRVLGVDPVLGRHITREEETAENRNLLISHRLWQEHFSGEGSALGSSIYLEQEAYTVIGIVPADFQEPFGRPVDVWIPQFLQPGSPGPGSRFSNNSRDNSYLSLIGRLKPGVTPEMAQAELDAIISVIDEEESMGRDPWRARTIPLNAAVVGNTGSMLYILLGSVILVLLIACVNVANLTLARGIFRERELAIRSALGSNRSRLIRQLLTESVFVSALGGLAGIVLAFLGVKVLLAVRPDALPRVDAITFDFTIFLFTAVVSLITGVVFGLLSAFRSSRLDIDRSLRETGKSTSLGMKHRQLRGILVVSQVGLAIILLICSGLLIRTLSKMNRLDLGFEPEQVLTFDLNLPIATYPVTEPARRLEFSREFLERVESLPGVRQAGAVSRLPVTGNYHSWGYVIEHEADAAGEAVWRVANIRIATEGYFETLGIELLRGRQFTSADLHDSPKVLVINQSMADRYYADIDPIGTRIFESGWKEVVGVVEDVRIGFRDEVPERIYMPYSQWADDRPWVMAHVIHADGMISELTDAVRAELALLDPDLVMFNVNTMEHVVGRAIARERFAMVLMLAFAGSALLLALVGIYGILSYTVSQRYREIGIRIALGAGLTTIRSTIIREGMLLTMLGIVIGTGAAFLLTSWMSSLIFEISVTDPVTFLLVAILLATVAWVTCLIPAQRATRTDPMEIMRTE